MKIIAGDFTSKKRRRILFVCRGSMADGMGHVMRSKALAKGMSEENQVKMVVLGDEYAGNLLVGRQLDYSIVKKDYQVLDFFNILRPDAVIFDTIHLEPRVFRAIHKQVLTISLSPIFNLLKEVDLFFHRTSAIDRHWALMPPAVKMYKGLDYTVIPDHCQKIPTSIYKDNLKHPRLSIAISMGGTDAANKTLAVLEKIKDIKENLLIWALLGEGYTHSYSDLVDCTSNSPHEIIMAKSNDSMWRILNTCSLAILAGGTTTYESAYSGLPSINMLESKRHVFLIDELVEKGACICAGLSFKESLGTLNGIIRYLNKNKNNLIEMHLKSRDLIDDRGVERIKRQIFDNLSAAHPRRANEYKLGSQRWTREI